jgi:membrane protease YdiL (CAAX protease family)
VIICWIGASLISIGAVCFSVWGARKGLISQSPHARPALGVAASGASRFGRAPLSRKELLWFRRDPGAMIQTILIPLTLAGVQLFNMRGVLREAQSAWNVLCGAAVVFGAYFLWVLGPRSLASEGAALWIALSWPRGVESLLKAKARLWSLIASAMVGSVLCYAAFRFPEHIWQIAHVGVGWFAFSRSMAEKAVTLVTVAASSGEPEKIPWGRRWATQLGMLTFGCGVLTQQWTVAFSGIVYSSMTAAAMWQNLRARLPYLYDPWAERLPAPPTLMHSMIAISALVDSGAVLSSIALAAAGGAMGRVMRPMIYGISGLIVCFIVWNFLNARGVALRELVKWQRASDVRSSRLLFSVAIGAASGLLLGLLGRGYLALLQFVPFAAEMIQRASEQMTQVPGLNASYLFISVLIVPFTEEFLFRGLLFRSLDREWSGWRGVLGSASFFAIYHPPLAWLPVALVGIANALLFKWSGWLAAPVALHMVYNAMVLS